ncbi:cytidyltransferase [Candidatus Epulonipiscium fishelsonii]|uniref:Cytidyltransferase n=1 Tax=Candidatus Epulonipiscium fishelsonii TaxID=77094 RepID=A0ACC8XHB3_9FIRM|nr:cytidyltransferase [Epulopiscium sp. SCG-B05WGA-EpuloA1]ONI42993.1 cytidyltransferase [Epulopiscium sp. SCG-B11WGA-EpuloA1]
MNIIAVIPARAGSRGIPNKNIRILGDKPLINYSLQNAKKSKFINEIIVTTDSEEVAIIAKQMNIKVHWRKEELCGDEITLDTVIYDAVKNIECDYVITLQPTSPTLKVETLDKAIEFILNNNNIDTLISAINDPHLAWRENNGMKYPVYESRLNRQFLPKYLIETGAFFITKKIYVTNESRLGKLMDVFEIPYEESIDIDNFIDLEICENIINSKSIAFYVNGNVSRGMGHIYRCLELADGFYVKPDIYYDINQTDKSLFGETTHNIIGINGLNELLTILSLKKYDIIINDILDTSIDYMIALKNCNSVKKIVNFEDNGEGALKADLVINSLYQHSDVPSIKTGQSYYICNKLFKFYNPIKIKDDIKCIFVSFGGADPQNYTDRVLQLICQDKYSKYNFIVVIGKAKQNKQTLLDYNFYKNIEVLLDVKNMPENMSKCDIAITSRGRTGYELAIMGIPTIAMAQNIREEHHEFISTENGFTYLGQNPSDILIEETLDNYLTLDINTRQKIQDKLTSFDLKNGKRRVINLINDL